jgi:hypothetical protein
VAQRYIESRNLSNRNTILTKNYLSNFGYHSIIGKEQRNTEEILGL